MEFFIDSILKIEEAAQLLRDNSNCAKSSGQRIRGGKEYC